ncbi:MAG: preprotein translocase subunit SecE [Patescibacteria group bacterium]
MGFMQYLKDTRGELNHVAWPTRLQTIVYTVIVISLSFLIALYLGLFDYIFTTSLRNVLQVLPATSAPSVQLGTSTSPITITQAPVASNDSTTTKK